MIEWSSFLIVLVASLLGACVVVTTYAVGLRLLTASGRIRVVTPAEFTDAITIMTPSEIKAAEKRAAKAARKSPLTERQKRLAFLGAWGCFALSGIAVLVGIYLILGEHLTELFL